MAGSGGAQDPARFGIGRLFWVMSEAVIAADLASETIALWNPAAERLFGYSTDEALGMRLEVLVPDSLRDQHLTGIRRYRDGGEPVLVGGAAVAVPAVTKAGERRDVALTLADVSPNDGPGQFVLALIRDVTDQVRAERELARANAAMREFVATASHDLRSPLASVLGYARLLSDGPDTTPEQRQQFAEAILRGAQGAARLVDDLLTLSQIQAAALPTRPQPVSVAAVARRVRDRLGLSASLDVDESVTVLVDEDHLERILVNYLSNAVRYGSPPLQVLATPVEGSVEVRICDAGVGVPESFVDRLFTSFARADPTVPEGTGLGLSIVKGLATANGGDAFYERRGEHGCCFGVVLPAANP